MSVRPYTDREVWLGSDVLVQNTLLDVYCKCRGLGDVGVTRQVFDEMDHRGIAPWNSIVGVYMSSRDATGANELLNLAASAS